MWRLARLCLVLLMLALPGLALAQSGGQPDTPDYNAWEKIASSAETQVQDGTINGTALDDLRSSITDWRQKFQAAEGVNSAQIDTVKAQISGLGPAPKEGETEDKAIASRRSQLNDELSSLQAPVIRAKEAESRADAIVANIDKLIRARQTDKLLRLTPTPLNPVNWPAALTVTTALGGALGSEMTQRLSGRDPYATLRDHAPVIVGLLLLALLLTIRGRAWIEKLALVLEAKLALRARRVIDAIVSLGQLFLPLAGVILLVTALRQTALMGPLWDELAITLAGSSTVIITSIWLAGRVFPKSETQEAPLKLLPSRRREGRILTITLGVLVAMQGPLASWITSRGEQVLDSAAKTAAQADALATTLDAGFGVLAFPVQVLGGLFLFRFGRLMRRHMRYETADNEESVFRDRLVVAIGSLVIAVAVIGPLLGAIGYVNAANALIWPLVKTLGLMALVLLTQEFFADLFVLVTRREDDARESLIPALIGFLLGLMALPIAALIWGARVDDLLELWANFQSGMSVGGVNISPGVFVTFVVIFMVGLLATRIVQGALKTSLLPKTKIDKGGQNAIVSGLGYLGIFLAALIAISSAGIDLSSLAIVAGALSVGVGFGLQTIVQNFVSGIILLIERPISEGDWIEVGSQMGIVKAISVRSTRIETFDRTEVIVPNADLISGQVTNWTRSNVTGRLILPVGVAYGTDTRLVEKILLEIAQNEALVMMNPEPTVVFSGFGASSLDFEIRAILSDVNFILRVKSDMNHEINARFAEAGIEIPFPQQDLWLRNPETLRAAPQRPATDETPPAPEKADEPKERAEQLGRPMKGEGMEEVDRQSESDTDGDAGGDGAR
ncbi:mechanosensitive ion channel protein MscS [Thioclava dalianensis]|uniref:Mechanosensitive ion channel protein MscS n=1 Tax=Thioclava dalianensis TaxID=1185766 RepID=A0A074TR98_9RHOB|nr:mechanosensitive ion channel protein MscS [Thioclava dalianensis]